MKAEIDRRSFLALTAASALLGRLPAQAGALAEAVHLGPAKPFSLDGIIATARTLARSPWTPKPVPSASILEQIDYDAYQQIKFSRTATIQLDSAGQAPVQLFHLGQLFKEPVHINLVTGAKASEILYNAELFDSPADHPASRLPESAGFAGFRVMGTSLQNDWLAFLGASYFRTSGPYNQYGLSARALAIDTGLPAPEEFPRFTEFWLAPHPDGGQALSVAALLESPRVTGAYKFDIVRTTDTRDVHRIEMTVDAHLFARADMARYGIAPFSSMFWYGEANREQARDWRPEIHDNDGLSIHTGSGERIWRPLINPPRVMNNQFVDRDPKGFGLLQRDRDFVHYLDDGVFYERRPSVWVEPLDPWGEGAVHLVEIPTDDETNDNIVAYWSPKEPFRAGEQRRFRYRLTWLDDIDFPAQIARATNTWMGLGGRPGVKRPPGVRKFVIDFQGPAFTGLGRNDGVEIIVTSSRGTISNAYSHPVVDQRERWRAFFDLEVSGSEPVDLRAYLRRGPQALTETWLYQYFPST